MLISSRQAEVLRLLVKNLNLSVDRDLLLNTVWSSASLANSLALNVQITYLRKALRNRLFGEDRIVDEERLCIER